MNDHCRYDQAATSFGLLTRIEAFYTRHSFPRHTHDYYAFAIVDAGVEDYFARGRYHLVSGADVVLLNPGDVHTGAAYDDRGWSYRMLVADPALIAQLARERGLDSGLVLFKTPVVRDQIGCTMLSSLLSHGIEQVDPLVLDEQLVALFDHLAGHHVSGPRASTAPSEADGLRRVRDFIGDNPARAHSLAELAGISGLSRTYLATAFRDRYGLPPTAFLLQERLARARRLLLAQDSSVAHIATEAGFYDQSDLNRHFVRNFGISPGRLRRQLRTSSRA
jgi:AraC-like DNA-binding protein